MPNSSNPFYVEPGNNYGPGLSGLAGVIDQVSQRKKQEAAQQAEIEKEMAARQEVREAYESKDPDRIDKVSIKYPELSNKINTALDRKYPGKVDVVKQAYAAAALDPTQIQRSYDNLKAVFAEDGNIDQQEQEKLNSFQGLIDSDPETAKKNVIADYLFMATPEEKKQFFEMTKQNDTKDTRTSEIKNYEYGLENPGFNKETDKGGTWGQPKEGIDGNGNPVSFVTDKDGNVKILEDVKPPPKKGMKIYDREGNLMVDMAGSDMREDIPRGAKTELFKDVIAGQETMGELDSISTMYEPEFLTYGGMYQSIASTILNKLDPENRDKFTQRRSNFMSAVNQSFIRYRKWATGVAGGEKEMAEIKRSIINENDSPQDFEAKLQLRKSITRRLIARQKAALKAGVNNEKQYKEYISDHSLDSIPTLQQRGNQLMKMGYDKVKTLSILREEGYILKGGE